VRAPAKPVGGESNLPNSWQLTYGIFTSMIFCCIRQQDPAISLEIAQLAADNRERVCAIDLAADEAGFAGSQRAPAFRLAERSGLLAMPA
jgi:adenosine deaminase